MHKDPVELIVQVGSPDGAAEELDRLGRSLRAEILELDVLSVEPVSAGLMPEGAKAVDWNLLGEWVVKLGVAAIPSVFDLLKRRSDHLPAAATIKIKVLSASSGAIELEYNPRAATPEQVTELIRHLEQPPGKK
jgi:hypothetical protein